MQENRKYLHLHYSIAHDEFVIALSLYARAFYYTREYIFVYIVGKHRVEYFLNFPARIQ